MANKSLQPKIDYNSMSVQDFHSVIAGGTLDKPLYEFDADGNAIYHEENLPYYTPNVILTNPLTGKPTTATGVIDYMKNQEKHQQAVRDLYNSILSYNHAYNVNATAVRAWKALGEFGGEAALTFGETVGNIANAVHSTGRTINESVWDSLISKASDRAKKEMMDILEPFDDAGADAYVKNHDFDNDLSVSDEAKFLFKNYRRLLKSRDNDNLWNNVLQKTFEGARENLNEAINQGYKGNRYQNLAKMAQFSGNIAGSYGVFKYTGIAAQSATRAAATAANAARATKIGAALSKAYGVTGTATVYGTSFFNQYDSLRRQGLANGLSYDDANRMAFIGGLWESFVEGKGASKFGRLSAKRSLWNVISSETVPEAIEEILQTGGENIFTALYGINSNSFRDVVEEIILSGLGGAIAGSAVGLADYANGQSRARIQAINEMREEKKQKALEGARSRNAEALQKQAEKLEKEQNKLERDSMAALTQKQQEGAEIAQQTAQEPDADVIVPNEQRFLLERDEQYAQELAQADEDFRNSLKEILSEKLKKVNPNASQQQIDNAAALLFRVSQRLDNNNEYTEAIDAWASDLVKWSNEKAPQYAKNLENLDKRFALDTLGLTPQDISDLKSNSRITRQNAEWKVVRGNINTNLKQAGVSSAYAEQISNAFEKVFAPTALISNISPNTLYEKFAPKIIGLSRASINKQHIAGYEGVLDNLPESLKATAVEQRVEAEGLIDSLADENTSKEADNNRDLAINEITRGMESKANVSAEDILESLETRASMEQALAQEMGVAYGHDLDFNDYKTIALMRARGASQADINDAFQLGERENPEGEFEAAKEKLFPRLSQEEIKQTERILMKANASNVDSEVSGVFVAPSADENIAQAGKELSEADKVGGTIVVGSDSIDKIAAEEFFHSLSVKMEEAAKIQAVKESGKKFLGAYDIYSMGLLPNTRPLARLFNELTKPINGIAQTDKEIHETLATAFVNHINMEIMKQEHKEDLNRWEAENNDVIATAEDSKYQNLSAEQKSALGERFTNLLNPKATVELIASGNKIANIGEDFDVLQAAELAMQILDQYEVYNGAQWAALIAKIDSLTPAEQVDLLQNFATNIVQQGYDLLVADTYFIDYDEKQRPMLIRKAYKENSLLTDEEPETMYFHSEALTLRQRFEQYKPDAEWLKGVKDWVKNTFNMKPIWQNYIETLSTAAFKADPVIGSVLRRAMFEHGDREIRLQKLASTIPALMEKNRLDISREEFKKHFKDVLNLGRRNARLLAKNWIVNKFAGTEDQQTVSKAMDDIFEALDSLRDELIGKGVHIGYIKEYWPTYVEKRQNMAEYLGYAAPQTATGRMVRGLVEDLRKKYKKASNSELRRLAIDTINRQWHKYSEGEQVTSFQSRGNYFNAETSDFYADPFEALARYFENANRTLLMRTLTGRVIPNETKSEYSTNLDRAISAYKAGESGEINTKETGVLGKAFALALTRQNPNWDALDNFAKQMKKFVNRTSDHQSAFLRFWQRTNSLLLGSPFSAMNQFQELSLTGRIFGLEVTNEAIDEAITEILKDAEGTIGANLENINVQPLQELLRYRENDNLAKITDLAHAISGFKGADILLKNIEIKAALKNAQKVLMSGENSIKMQRFIRDFDKCFPDLLYTKETRNQVMQELREGRLTENVKFFLFNYMSDVQPINSAEVPAGYNAAGQVGRLVYQYRTTPLRQLEYVVNDIEWGFQAAKEGKIEMKDAIMNLLGFLMYFAAIGVPIAAVQALLRGKKPNLAEEALYSPLQLLMINEYTVNSVQQKGLFRGFASEFTPSFRVGDDVSKDLIRFVSGKSYQGNAVKDVPVMGPFAYYWFLGGRDHAKRHGEAIGYDPEDNQKYYNSVRAAGGR